MSEKTNDEPAEQMLACLDVLWEQLQAFIGGDDEDPPFPPHEELVAAYWQIPELVFAMADELARVYDLLERMVQDQQERATVRSILLGPDGRPA